MSPWVVLQGVTKEDIERAELALQAANKGIDLAAVSANKRSSENKENKPERTTEDSVLRKVWTDVSQQSQPPDRLPSRSAHNSLTIMVSGSED